MTVQSLLSSILPQIPAGYVLGRRGSGVGAVQLLPIKGLTSSATTKAAQTGASQAASVLASAEAYASAGDIATLASAKAYADALSNTQATLVTPVVAGTSPISGHVCVYGDGTGLVAVPSLASVSTGAAVFGITIGAIGAGATGQVLVGGSLSESSWAWGIGPIYCGDEGVLTQSPTTTGWLRQVAVAVAPTKIVLGIGPMIVL